MFRFVLTCLVFLISNTELNAQIITTIAGNGIHTNTGDGGLATASTIVRPVNGAFDKFGNYYVTTGHSGCIRKISASGIITTVAGNGTIGYSGDGGPATLAQLKNVNAVVLDTAGNMYIADGDPNNRIRKVNKATGIITTIAGTGVGGYNGDNIPATAAQVNGSLDLCLDKFGNLFIADYLNQRVRKISTTGIITTVAGNGSVGFPTTSGVTATSVPINVSGVCIDINGDLLIADWHGRIYKVDSRGMLTFFAGNGIGIFSGDGGLAIAAGMVPAIIRADRYGNVFVVDFDLNRVRLINGFGYIRTVAGNGELGYSGDGGLATMAKLYSPAGIAIDSCGNLYIADAGNARIRKVTYPKCNYLDVPDALNEAVVQVYPNPTYETLHIDGLQTAMQYRLIDVAGREWQHGALRAGNNEVPVPSLTSGIYLLELTDEQGYRTVRRIVKE